MLMKQKLPQIILAGAFAIFAIFVVAHVKTFPGFWYDEGVNIMIARAGAEQGYLNIQTAPGVQYPKPYQFSTSGYPLSAPLAALFKIFGFSFALARVYMLLWFALLLATIFALSRRLWGNDWLALSSSLFVGLFAPVVYHGLSVIGEIPGVTFVLLSAIFIDKYFEAKLSRDLYLSALFIGLAVATKPLYMVVGPAILLVLIWQRDKLSLRNWFEYLLSALVPVALFLWSVLPAGLGSNLLSVYQSRATQGSWIANIGSNFVRLLSEPSLIATTLLLVGLIFFLWIERKKVKPAQIFLSASALLMLCFFLQSVGWNRYLVLTQVIFLMFLPHILLTILTKLGKVKLIVPIFVVLLLAEFGYALAGSKLAAFSGDRFERLDSLVQQTSGSVYVVSIAEAAALVPTDRLYFFTRFEDRPQVPNQLQNLATKKFDYIIAKNSDPDLTQFQAQMGQYYTRVDSAGSIYLYKLKPSP